LTALEDQVIFKKALNQVLRYLTYRARSRKEVVDYLKKKGYSAVLIEKTVKKIEEFGYIDDDKFTREYINYRKSKGQGINRVRYELKQKGIDRDLLEEKIEEMFDYEEDLARAKELLDRRRNTTGREEHRESSFSKEVSFLKRRGFQDGVILDAVKNKNY
jgi:regulatory protein